jgi:hypothetical protein
VLFLDGGFSKIWLFIRKVFGRNKVLSNRSQKVVVAVAVVAGVGRQGDVGAPACPENEQKQFQHFFRFDRNTNELFQV